MGVMQGAQRWGEVAFLGREQERERKEGNEGVPNIGADTTPQAMVADARRTPSPIKNAWEGLIRQAARRVRQESVEISATATLSRCGLPKRERVQGSTKQKNYLHVAGSQRHQQTCNPLVDHVSGLTALIQR